MNVNEKISCPSSDEFERVDYRQLAQTHGYEKLGKLLDELAPMIGRGEVSDLPEAHPSLYARVAEITSDWSFADLHSCASHRIRQCPMSLREIREATGKPEYEALRYVLFRLAAEKSSKSSTIKVQKDVDDIFQQIGFCVPVENPEFPNEMRWFTPQELGEFFGMTTSSKISRSSRKLRPYLGYFLIRRDLHPGEKPRHKNLTYLYRPATLEEKIRDRYYNFNSDPASIVRDLSSLKGHNLSLGQVLRIINLKEEEVPRLNPLDITSHNGDVDFDAVLNRVQQSVTDADKPSKRSFPDGVSTSGVNDVDTNPDPETLSELTEQVGAILRYTLEVGLPIDMAALRAAVGLENPKDLFDVLKDIDEELILAVM